MPNLLSRDALAVAQAGASKLAELNLESGQFRYRYEASSNAKLSGYNVLRHSGTVWSMLDVFSVTKDEQLLTAANKAITYLFNEHLRFFGGYLNFCILEKNSIKLGGNALAALALAKLYEINTCDVLRDTSYRLCQFILEQRKLHGDFVHKRYFKSGKISSFRSEYYVGEALLALLACYRITGDSLLLNTVLEVEADLAAQGYGVREQSHWMLYSLEQLQQFDKSPHIYAHAEQIASEIIDNPNYLDWGRSTPTACRTEGLLAFIRMHPPENATSSVQDAALKCIEENLQRQLLFQTKDGAFVRGGGDRRDQEVRIDYIQHNISAFLHFSQLEKSQGNPHQ
ncbi:MAG: hypothetical protein P8O91_08105 [Luminiphilus sp.]|nr:hypothetical protein [Luminiphilus sp.]